MKYTRYCRSVLCTPATSVERYAKCHQAGADICLVDLEDSVPPPQKEEARIKAESFFSAPSAASVRCAVRVNGVTEPDGLRDLLALHGYPVKPAIVLVPKVEAPRDIEIVEQLLRPDCPDVELFAVIETPRGLENVTQIATTSRRLRALIFGAADYSFALGSGMSWAPMAHARARIVNAARAAGIEAIDSPTFELADAAQVQYEATLARELGFSGKVALNPHQVTVINETFSPDAELLDRARRVVSAAQEHGQGITVVDGSMVGKPFFEASRRLLDEFGSSR
ncbi:CoA ester lyase [Micromonospora polyrhachis]|uniref:Citrate lyase subunit beta/citryl-CoA lyase/(S)-citramalyl-CoA lyase n=1 Tax=Micromonospora polyrhachis TaxID=1282883 RepID=A0A7W7SWZ1_9ACTN|nr:CoA ester lyase [Micromonospora polyrhachis]MBB4962466.1 citrate lyase subunit beta/citryl-CoA lyase/(S)-citramalyl-CoA lyase [Micromonospora polyrhachis]